jgi:Holliday junction resolvase RusA-like endonuclease
MLKRRRLVFEIIGIAQPKGSTRAFVPLAWAKRAVAANRQPRAVITSDNPRTRAWADRVAEAAAAVAGEGLFLGPIALELTFYLPRPQSLPRRVVHHLKKPDLDKLIRATNDALTGVLYRDDAQIVEIRASKLYAAGLAAPHAIITIEETDPPAPRVPAHSLFTEVPAHAETASE